MSLIFDTMEEFDSLLQIYERATRLSEMRRHTPVVEAAAYLANEAAEAIVELHKECVAEDPKNSKDVVVRTAALLDEKEVLKDGYF